MAIPLARPISDHIPCFIMIRASIPKSYIFWFENYWLQHPDFKETFENIWDQQIHEHDSSKRLTANCKRPRKGLKLCSKNISIISTTIKATNSVI